MSQGPDLETFRKSSPNLGYQDWQAMFLYFFFGKRNIQAFEGAWIFARWIKTDLTRSGHDRLALDHWFSQAVVRGVRWAHIGIGRIEPHIDIVWLRSRQSYQNQSDFDHVRWLKIERIIWRWRYTHLSPCSTYCDLEGGRGGKVSNWLDRNGNKDIYLAHKL